MRVCGTAQHPDAAWNSGSGKRERAIHQDANPDLMRSALGPPTKRRTFGTNPTVAVAFPLVPASTGQNMAWLVHASIPVARALAGGVGAMRSAPAPQSHGGISSTPFIHTGIDTYPIPHAPNPSLAQPRKAFTAQGVLAMTKPKTKPHACSWCGKSFDTPYKLTIHIRTHTGERPFQCSLCKKRFRQRTHLREHFRVHTGERPYKCPHCPMACNNKSNFNKHLRVHTGEKPYRCSKCGKRFSQKSNLTKHLKSHAARARLVTCSTCGWVCASRADLREHELTHERASHAARQRFVANPWFLCQLCGAELPNKDALIRHVRVHENERRDRAFVCERCDRSFPSQAALSAHKSGSHVAGSAEVESKRGARSSSLQYEASAVAYLRQQLVEAQEHVQAELCRLGYSENTMQGDRTSPTPRPVTVPLSLPGLPRPLSSPPQ